jgi:hypothetical protein
MTLKCRDLNNITLTLRSYIQEKAVRTMYTKLYNNIFLLIKIFLLYDWGHIMVLGRNLWP